MQKAAQKIEKDYQGKMPVTYQELLKLPGIGEYTAGAISSIANNEKVAAVDGNVLRVIARVTGSRKNVLLPETKKEVTRKLIEIMPAESGNFNEALMELGELICLPNGIPVCEKCPLQTICKANREGTIQQIPVREKKMERKKENRTVYILTCKGKIAIKKREQKGLLAGMYEFPNTLGIESKTKSKETLKKWSLKPIEIQELAKCHHIFSHIEWKMIGYKIEVEKENEEFLWVTKEELIKEYPIPSAFEAFKKKIENK